MVSRQDQDVDFIALTLMTKILKKPFLPFLKVLSLFEY